MVAVQSNCNHLFGELAGARTQDPNIKSVVLYLLSYEFNVPKWDIPDFGGAKIDIIFVFAKYIRLFLISIRFLSMLPNRITKIIEG